MPSQMQAFVLDFHLTAASCVLKRFLLASKHDDAPLTHLGNADDAHVLPKASTAGGDRAKVRTLLIVTSIMCRN